MVSHQVKTNTNNNNVLVSNNLLNGSYLNMRSNINSDDIKSSIHHQFEDALNTFLCHII